MGENNDSDSLLVWHPEVHERFGEALYFYFINFHPVYNRKAIFGTIAALLKTLGIEGWSCYEVYGEFDIVLRLWARAAIGGARLERHLKDALAKLHIHDIQLFSITNCLLHWSWPETSEEIWLTPVDKEVLNALSVSQISALQRGEASDEELGRCKTGELVRFYRPCPRIKFFVVLSNPYHRNLPPLVESAFLRSIRDKVRQIEEIGEVCLYEGMGIGWMILEAAVEKSRYDSIARLVGSINVAGLDLIDIRTITYLVVGQEAYCERDGVYIEVPAEPPPVFGGSALDYLNRDESQTFEVKASLDLDVKKWLHTGKVEKLPALLGEVIGTVDAFLNADGGELLIGAIETRNVPQERKGEFPTVGFFSVVGIEVDYGSKDKGWDGFVLRLTDIMAKKLGGDAIPILGIERLSYADHDLCLIRVPRGRRWYYVDGQFHVRLHAQSRVLSGEEQERYQMENPRKLISAQ